MKSPYLSAPKTKHESFFPKIHRAEYRDTTHQITKSTGKQNLFKNGSPIKITKNQKAPYERQYDKKVGSRINESELEEARIKQSKQYRQLQIQIEQMTRRFNSELLELEKKRKQTQKRSNQIKKDLYDQKLDFWQLKNDTINLQQIIKQEEYEHSCLLQELGYNQQPLQQQQNQ